MSSTAAGMPFAPPYQMADTDHVLLDVVWEPAAVRAALPPGLTPVAGMTGGINLYCAPRAYPIGPYSSAYFWVDIEGMDSPEGVKGRWMLAGVYGPDPRTAQALTHWYGLPVRTGTMRFEPAGGGRRAIGTVAGRDFITAEVRAGPAPAAPAAAQLRDPGVLAATGAMVVNVIPFVADVRPVELVSLQVNAPAGDPFARYTVARVVAALEVKNGAFAFSRPGPPGA